MLLSLLEERERRKVSKCALQYSSPACCIIKEGENLVFLSLKPLSCLMQPNPVISQPEQRVSAFPGLRGG